MHLDSRRKAFRDILFDHLDDAGRQWLEQQLASVCTPPSTRNLYLAYSLLGRRLPETHLILGELSGDLQLPGDVSFTLRELGRVYLLYVVLSENPGYFIPGISKLIQVADTGELVTFLRFLSVLPQSGEFRSTAVEALRTNIAPVFEAIAMDNPYPKNHFDDQQWNQMYLKAAFMGLDLTRIQGVQERANEPLARIISDYAHERWAASRKVDPLIWQPVAPFLSGPLLEDMKRLLASPELPEQRAGLLSCLGAGAPQARQMALSHELYATYVQTPFTWNDINL